MKKRGKRSQASTEYLMVAALGLIVVIPLIYVFYSSSLKSLEEVRVNQIREIGNAIINNAENVYYQGEPARVTFEYNFPDGIGDITILGEGAGHYELVFNITEGNDLFFVSKVPINGDFEPKAYSAGTKNIKVEAIADQVTITIF